MFKNFGEFLVKIALPFIEKVGKQAFIDLLNNFYAKHPTDCATLLVSVYPALDVQLENYVKETKTQVDDDLVDDLKSAIEAVAATHGITLPNLDAGQPND